WYNDIIYMTIKYLEKIFKSLATRKRLEIIKLLTTQGGMSVSDIANRIKLSLKSTSKHLIVLRQAGFLDREQKQYDALYSLAADLSSHERYLLKLVSD
ncbi:TPA: hypothetical protein DEB72_03800, partial [Patescibacteria group bacterium]|nr:hypothetical protein [Patescibacteria group bacterium]